MHLKTTTLSALLSALVLCSCASTPAQKPAEFADEKSSSGAPKSPSNVLAREALETIRTGDLAKASRAINLALNGEPENANLHFLNGFVYHLLANKGDPAQRDFAETGYLLALKFAPDHQYANHYLGQLYLDGKRWSDARDRFAQSIWIDNTQPAAYLGLAAAAYHARDLSTAGWAAKKGLSFQPTDAGFLKTAVLVSSASGDQANTPALLERYRHAEPDQRQYAATERRVKQWDDVYKQQPLLLAEAGPAVQGGGIVRQDAVSPSALAVTQDAIVTNVLTSWLDCPANNQNQFGQAGGGGYGGGSSSGADESAALPALPSPCQGKPLPLMAIIDATILRTDNLNGSSHGLNLLNSLAISFTNSSANTVTTIEGVASTQNILSRGASLGTSAAAGIAYSLNLFNVTESRADVLARPTLVVLDRKSSQFFSGSTISVALGGGVGGNGSVIDKPVGVSLSVTPTFVNKNTMLLAVKATRSYIEPGNNNSTFAQVMQTSRNTVTANVLIDYGQTLVLSGLSERELDDSSSGVPVLKDLPITQYLFGTKVKSELTKSVVILLTPRKPPTGEDSPPEMAVDIDAPQKLKTLLQGSGFTPDPNLVAIFRQMNRNPFYREFRTGDLYNEDWRRKSYLMKLLNDFSDTLFF